ncbi:unnamed protein product [Peniophora sp. CBMAI 1063]|nr:unnamed protein product [Peniophora sp. CBMAI 1063]
MAAEALDLVTAELIPPMYPRFDAPDAEIILRSSDGVDFAVYKAILLLVAPIFESTLSLPQPPGVDDTSSRPVVHMAEDADTLLVLLRFSYPRAFTDEPRLLSIMDIKRTAMLAQKYDITFMHDKAERALVTFCKDSPFVSYAVAWRFDYFRTVRYAARRCLDFPEFFHPDEELEIFPEFDEVPGTAFIALYRYHAAVPSCLQPILLCSSREYPVRWIQADQIQAWAMDDSILPCSCGKKTIWVNHHQVGHDDASREWRVCSWWWLYVHATVTTMQSDERSSIEDALETPLMEAWERAALCCYCRSPRVAHRVLEITKATLRCEIERLLDTVDPFCTTIGLHAEDVNRYHFEPSTRRKSSPASYVWRYRLQNSDADFIKSIITGVKELIYAISITR